MRSWDQAAQKGHEHCSQSTSGGWMPSLSNYLTLCFVTKLKSFFFPFLGSDEGGSDVEEEGADYEGRNEGSEGHGRTNKACHNWWAEPWHSNLNSRKLVQLLSLLPGTTIFLSWNESISFLPVYTATFRNDPLWKPSSKKPIFQIFLSF